MRPTDLARAGLALALAALLGGCLFGGGDDDKQDAEKAAALALDTPVMDSLTCDEDGDGDCGDWYALQLDDAGPIELSVVYQAGKGSPAMTTLTLTDAKTLALAEAKSGGKSRYQLGYDVEEPGTYYAWIRVDDPKGAEQSYQIKAARGQGGGGGGGDDDDQARMCVRLDASENANYYGGSPHVLRVLVFALESTTAFEQADVETLLAPSGPTIGGIAGKPTSLTIVPGEKRAVNDPMPKGVRAVGVVADYYRASGQSGGPRKVTVSCSRGARTVHLGENELSLR
jgi:type VI secretion system VasD/TssJ family lipoprotein